MIDPEYSGNSVRHGGATGRWVTTPVHAQGLHAHRHEDDALALGALKLNFAIPGNWLSEVVLFAVRKFCR